MKNNGRLRPQFKLKKLLILRLWIWLQIISLKEIEMEPAHMKNFKTARNLSINGCQHGVARSNFAIVAKLSSHLKNSKRDYSIKNASSPPKTILKITFLLTRQVQGYKAIFK